MNIYLITSPNSGWDTYDAMVVIAKNEKQAIELTIEDRDGDIHSWAKFEDLEAFLLGKAIKGSKEKIVFQSFNAG